VNEHTTSIPGSAPSAPLSTRSDLLRILVTLVLLAPALLLLVNYRPTVAMMYFAALMAVALVSLPRVTFVLFFLSNALHLPYMLNKVAVLPFDILLAILFFSVFLEFLLRGRSEIRSTGLDLAFLALIAATFVSAVLAHNRAYSVLPTIRIVMIYIAFRMVYKFALEMGVRRITLFYIYLVMALAAINVVLFLIKGGQARVFGPAWLGFETYSMTALPMAVGFLIWSRTFGERLKYLLVAIVIGFGMLASQSRGPMLAVVVAVPLLFFFATLKARREQTGSILRIGRLIFVPLIVVSAAVLFLRQSLFEHAVERLEILVESLKNPQETILLRLVLAKAAIKGFLAHPIFGVGIGNFKIIDQVVPEMRMDPVWFYLRGMSAHNVVLHYLAETGIVGTVALLSVAWLGVRSAYRSFRRKLATPDQQVSAAIFAAMLVFSITLWYMRAWTWGQGGYIMAILFGLSAAWYRQTSPAESPTV